MPDDITLAGGAGEYMESATVVSWAAALGDRVKAGDVVVVVETAKAATEIEAGCDGVLAEILAPVGAEVGIGAVLGRIADSLGAIERAEEPIDLAETSAHVPPAHVLEAAIGQRIKISPLARRLAAQAGLGLTHLVGTGPSGRIKSRDVERALEARTVSAASIAAAPPAPAQRLPNTSVRANVPLVLIHGFGANASAWNALKPYFDEGRRVLTPELPGHGRAAALASPSLDALADAVLSQIEAAGVEECDLVGHSLGGAVAAALSANPAIRVRSLTLIAPAGLGVEINDRFLEGFLSARVPESLAPWLELLVADASRLPRSYAQAVLRERSRLGLDQPQAAVAQYLFPDGAQAFSIKNDVKRFTGPLKVIWGRSDRIISPMHLRGLPGHVACHGIDDTGHMPHVEAPSLTAQLVMQCLRSGASF